MAVERLRVEGFLGLLVLVLGGSTGGGVGVDVVVEDGTDWAAVGKALVTSAGVEFASGLLRRLAGWRGVGVAMKSANLLRFELLVD